MNTTLSNPSLALAPVNVSKVKLWTGRVLTGLPSLFILIDGLVKQLNLPAVVDASEKVGFHQSALPIIGLIEIFVVVCLCFRRTAALGAVVVTGYLGGAVATHLRNGDPLFALLLPVLFAVAIWGGLALRNERIRALSPVAR